MDNCGLDHWIHRWVKPEIWCSYLRSISASFYPSKIDICPCCSLHLFRELDETHAAGVRLHLLRGQHPQRTVFTVACKSPCGASLYQNWLLLNDSISACSSPACQGLVSYIPLMHCLCQVRYLYCNGTAAVYFSLWSYLIFWGHWSLFLVSTRQLKHDVNAKVQENVQRRKKISLGPFILHYWKGVHMDIRVAHYLKNTAATHETGVLWEIFRPTMLAWCIVLHWEWRLQKKRTLIA